MPKHKRTIVKLIVAAAIMFLFVFYIYKYNDIKSYSEKISRSLNGIKYQSGYNGSYSIVKIEINGIYKKTNEESGYSFEGDIIIDGEPCSENIFLFNEHNMASLKTDSIQGMFYISDGMEDITIEIFELDDRGKYKFSYDGGWIISAPSKNREEAVIITNKLKYQNGDYAW